MNFAYKTCKHPNKANSQHLNLYTTNKEKYEKQLSIIFCYVNVFKESISDITE